ncbi:MAG TPA: DUF2269 family protein [Gaiellaceae bacterium]
MTWYTFFKWIHVAAAATWVGGAVMIQAYAFRILGTNDGKRQADFAKDTEVVSTRLFIPTTWVLLLAAIGMMINLHWSWGQNWIVFGLIAWALSFVIGAGFLGPEGGRIAAIIEQHGPESPLAQARIRRILMVSRAELVVLLGVIWNMVVKPVGMGGWFWGALVVMVLGVVAVVASYLRAEQNVPNPAAQ